MGTFGTPAASRLCSVESVSSLAVASGFARDPVTRSGEDVHAMSARIDRLDDDYREFCNLVTVARRHLANKRLEVAAVYAQIAAQFAWFNHTGLFASGEIEALLAELGGHIKPIVRSRPRTSQPTEVLHVVTQVYQTGGPTQAISCWMEQENGRHHRVCITRQGPSRVPAKILSRLNASSDLIRLDSRLGGLLARAAALRVAASDADVVLLHSHPYDVIPLVAFAGADRNAPPIIYVNHGDHVFWLGGSIASVVMNMRDSGRLLSNTRRGIDPARSLVAARPLRIAERSLTREAAKRGFGVRSDQVLVVTAADAPKYRAVAGPNLLDLIIPVFEICRNAALLAAGPDPQGCWAAAAAKTAGRVRALGRLPDVTMLHQAADIYLDSFPFSSLTSLLEAGSFGTPVITYRGHIEDCAVLGADTRGVDECMLRPANPEALQGDLLRLIVDPDLRHDLGTKIQRAIVETHKGDGWRNNIANIYKEAARLDAKPTTGEALRGRGTLDILVNGIMAETGYRTGVTGAVRDNLGLLPATYRFIEYTRLMRTGVVPSVRYLVPEWLLPWVAPWWRFARRLWRPAINQG